MAKEKERFFVIIENMVRNVGMKDAEFIPSKVEAEIIQQERILISNFIGG